MTVIVSRAFRLAVVAAIASAILPHQATAQVADPSFLLAVKATVPAGEAVEVTDIQGKTVTGVLGSVTSEAVEVIVKGQTRRVPAGDIHRIRWQQQDSWITGALIGAGIGAIPGLYYLITDPNECTGMCPEEYALIGIGALVGALIDKAMTRRVTVYERSATGVNVAVTPVLSGSRRGVQVTVKF